LVLAVQADKKVDRLYAVDPSTKTRHPVRVPLAGATTSGGALSMRNPVWSHDGAFIAFRDADYALFMIRRDGTGMQKLGENAGAFRWSPTADVLVYTNDAGYGAVWIARPGARPRRIVSEGSNPQWRADGKILFERNYGHLLVASPDGNDVAKVADEIQDWHVSPDGKLVAFEVLKPGAPLEIMTAWGTNRRTVFPPSESFFPVAWSPDSRRLAFFPSSSSAIYLADADGGKVRRIPRTFHDLSYIEWSPGSTMLAVEMTVLVGPVQLGKTRVTIAIMNVNGSGLRTLLTGRGNVASSGLRLSRWELTARVSRWER
jgi:Tol biopolymer transport system component